MDPLGTPINSLPSITNNTMGKVQHKSDMPKIDNNSLSYTDILKNLEQETNMPPGGGGALPPPPPPPPQQQASFQSQQYDQQQFAPQQSQMYYQDQGPPPQYYQGYNEPQQSSPISNFWVDNRTLIIVSALIFVVMLYIAPKLKLYIPQLATDGNLNVVGIATVSLVIGLATQIVDKYV